MWKAQTWAKGRPWPQVRPRCATRHLGSGRGARRPAPQVARAKSNPIDHVRDKFIPAKTRDGRLVCLTSKLTVAFGEQLARVTA
jgi:hypothetical protein